MAKRITNEETEDGWRVTIDGGDQFHVTIEQVRRLRDYLTRLIEPSARKMRIRNRWKQIVENDYKFRRPDRTKIAHAHKSVAGDEYMIQWTEVHGKHQTDLILSVDEFISNLRQADRAKARQVLTGSP